VDLSIDVSKGERHSLPALRLDRRQDFLFLHGGLVLHALGVRDFHEFLLGHVLDAVAFFFLVLIFFIRRG